jgi:UDP-N-acetylmuramyl pentapeptide phosphotransferase/UDP-N-acetylglucosamine-1-phosphate transferase
VPFLAPPLVACCLTALLIVLLRRPAERLRLIDHPGGRERHSHPVPLTGGIALTLGFHAALPLSFGAIGAMGWRAWRSRCCSVPIWRWASSTSRPSSGRAG